MDYGNAENEPKQNDWTLTLDWDYKLTVLYKCNTDNTVQTRYSVVQLQTVVVVLLLARSATTAAVLPATQSDWYIHLIGIDTRQQRFADRVRHKLNLTYKKQ